MHWAMMFVAFIVGIPVFFQVGFVLLIPLLFTIAIETGISLVTIGISLIAGLSVVHGLVPPHPAAMAAVGIYHANVGKTIFFPLLSVCRQLLLLDRCMESGLESGFINQFQSC
ncbi:hypothetical protein BsIDN1_69710 [Bacillus safensis]|uniref:TRAP C4-dicarboxylate transport system permease DctM subunit domain-containing protein n=1 Tax=Bacillus safensis TaxID=561879 RepID=A0A5S9MJU1_BACIA|nr:hypothetical protein BsIDN1_69710 [Bacillus safensis]